MIILVADRCQNNEMPTNEAVVCDMDRLEIVDPGANGEGIFRSISGKLVFGYENG
jgi:hypothetical protein